MSLNNLQLGQAPLVVKGYQRLTPDNVTPLLATIPVDTKFMSFTCENNAIRWLTGPAAQVATLSSTVGNPLPVTWAQAMFEYTLQANQPVYFISQSDQSSVVNITYYG